MTDLVKSAPEPRGGSGGRFLTNISASSRNQKKVRQAPARLIRVTR